MAVSNVIQIISISDVIQIISIIVSAILTFVSLGIAVKSLKQSQKSIELAEKTIEEANRPYVVVYRDYIQVLNAIHEYLIIKNFGCTGAVIDSLDIYPPYTYKDFDDKTVFANIEDTFIAPNQSINTVTFLNASNNDRTGITKIIIKYHTDMKTYSETYSLNEDLKCDIRYAKPLPSKKKSIEEIVCKTTEELLRRNL